MTTNNSWNSAFNSALGALLAGDGNRPQIVPVGVDGLVLTADSGAAQGVSWQTGFNPAATSAFYAGISAPVLNVTGNGANYSAIFDTIVFQNGTGYSAGTGIFTAPVSGVYQFNTAVSLSAIGALMTAGQLTFLYNGGTVVAAAFYNPFAEQNTGGPAWGDDLVVTYEMTAGDTMQVQLAVAGGPGDTITFGIVGATFFAGYLVSTSGGVSGIFGPGVSTDRAIATWNGITGTAQYDNPTTRITAAGEMTNTGQPIFFSTLPASDVGVTGTGTPYFFGSGNALTVNQQGTSMSTAGVFTAPVTGWYEFEALISLENITVGMATYQFVFVLNGVSSINAGAGNAFAMANAGGALAIVQTLRFPMTATDTMQVAVSVTGGGGDTVDVTGSGGNPVSWFSGVLVC